MGGVELKIDPKNMEAIIKWPIPTNVTEFRSFFGEANYPWKFTTSFLVVVALLHAIKTRGNSFQ
jgi:hypothetical protein